MLSTAVDDLCFGSTAGQGSDAGTNLRNHAAVDLTADDQLLGLFKGHGGNKAVFITVIGINTAYVGQHQQLFCLQRTCDFAGNAVGVDVVGFTLCAHAGGSDNRNKAVIEQAVNQLGVDVFNIANITDINEVNLAVFVNVCQMLFSLNKVSILAV